LGSLCQVNASTGIATKNTIITDARAIVTSEDCMRLTIPRSCGGESPQSRSPECGKNGAEV
jgi:hypothetical protein